MSLLSMANTYNLVVANWEILYHCKYNIHLSSFVFHNLFLINFLSKKRYAHRMCFMNWFMDNGYPKQCPNCKSNYNVTFFSFFLFTGKLLGRKILLFTRLFF
ncbi:uncharacterized protein B0P05DRAFT_558670 [Gilbertella persicaria]|uniref:uncharacterized protein n=1 Tax=Gilbertella persicaria TaxID=101096 RepID=UPI00222069DC|nr:uncharacterized protein B0P05DRAFT_558670 [Gilbertella persicaria]KAI8059428.1 hypothetical protein B0P05DRAFT_558670 [Gilbertella persicaria]